MHTKIIEKNVLLKYWKVLKCIAVLLLCLVFFVGLFPVDVDAGTKDKNVSSGQTVRVGYFSEADSYMKGGSDSAPKSGYAYDYLQKIAEYTGWHYKYVYGDWSDLLSKLESGKIDLLFNVSYTKERAGKMLFSSISAGKETNYIYSRAKDSSINTTDYNTLNGKKIGVYRAGIGNQYSQLMVWLKKHGITCRVVQYDSSARRNAELANGKLDAIVATDSHTDKSWRPIVTVGSSNYYFAVAKGRSDILSELNSAQNKILTVSPYYNEELQQKYFHYSVIQQSLTQKETEWIATHKSIRVGYLNNYLPYCAEDKNGKLKGVATKVLTSIARDYGVRFSCVSYDSYKKMTAAFNNGDLDIMVPASGNPWLAEKNSYLRTEKIADASMAILSNGGSSDGLFTSIAVSDEIPLQKGYISANYPKARLIKCSSAKECMKAVLYGRAKSTIIDSSYLQLYMKNSMVFQRLHVTQDQNETSVSFAVNRKDIILLPILNKGIIAIGSDALSNAKVSYSLSGAKVTFLDMVKNDHLATILLFIIFLILLMAIILLTKNDRRLAEARKAADEANIAKSGFLSRMSHEIRTPMNAVVGLTILARQQEDDRQKLDEYLAKVQNSSKVLLSLINDVLDMSAIESGKLKIASQKFNLRMVLNGIDSIYRTQCQDKGVDFTMNIDLPQDEYVGDSLRINQILLNLVSNAFKFTEKGESIAVTVSQIRSSEETACLSFIVSDTGCGMNKELLERLFKPFEQAGAETAMKHGGSGLGLSITKNLVTMMDGTIDVDSAPGMGSTFKVNLTLKNCEQDSYVEMPGTAIMDTSQQIHYDFTGHKVLIAEDNEINAEVAGGLLTQVNMDADYAENGQRALELFKSSAPGAYDAILMDVQMPVMNGYEATRAIRDLGRPDAETICIFALTAGAFTEDIDNALKSGMNDHIAKPIEPEELYSKLQSVIDHEKQ